MKKNKYILLLPFLYFIGCQNPSSPNVSLVSSVATFSTYNDVVELDVDDNYIVLAASDDGYKKFSYQINSEGVFELTLIEPGDEYDVNFDGNHDINYLNDSFDKVMLSSNNDLVYILDRGLGGSSGVWFDNLNGSINVPFFTDFCFQSKYLDIAIHDSSIPGSYDPCELGTCIYQCENGTTCDPDGDPCSDASECGLIELPPIQSDFSHTIYALLKHTNLGGLVNFACEDGTPCSPEFPNCPVLDNGDAGTCTAVPEYECSDDQNPCDPTLVFQCVGDGSACDPDGEDCADESDCEQIYPCGDEGVECVPKIIDIQQYSTSIAKIKINFIRNGDLIDFYIDNGCELVYSGIGYYSKDIDFNNNVIAVANQSEGILVFEENTDGELIKSSSFNVSGAEAQSVLLDTDAVIGGFSTSSGGNGGCYIALLGANSNNDGNYDSSFAEGYSVKNIDVFEDLIALATGNNGVQIYQRMQGSEIVVPYLSINTDYAFDVKIRNNFVFVATKSGLEVHKIGI